MSPGKKVLVVGMLDSVHLAGWLTHFVGKDIEFKLFPSGPNRRLHRQIGELLARHGDQFSIVTGAQWLGLPSWMLDKVFGNRFRSFFLRRLADNWRPNLVHALELQNAGYLCHTAFARSKREFEFGVTNYGSDIYWFSQKAKHRRKLKSLLGVVDFYSAECERDVELAKELGYRGQVRPVFPNSGGIPDDIFRKLGEAIRPRDAATLKGYHGWAGRALVGLDAIEKIAHKMPISTLYIHSASLATRVHVWRMRENVPFEIRIYSKGSLTREEVLTHLSQSLVFIGISRTDGISTTMLEAMAVGAIPVQTSTACCHEWFSDSGVAISEINREAIATAILKGFELAKTDKSRKLNWATIKSKGLKSVVAAHAETFYSSDQSIGDRS